MYQMLHQCNTVTIISADFLTSRGWHMGCDKGSRSQQPEKLTMRSLFAVALALVVSSALPACAINASQNDDQGDVTDESDDALSTGKFETFTGKDGKVYFHLLAGNGERVLGSEGYASGAAAINAISLLQTSATFELRTASN